jgi:two-component system NtrC family sensor kinase
MTEVVSSVAHLLRAHAEAAGVHLAPQLEPGLPRVRADRFRLEQVMLNLIRNAVDATPPGGRVDVRVLARDGCLEVSVRDEGPGIPPAVLPRLFEPFFTTKAGGTGLGLAVSQSIIRGLGGDIVVTSSAGDGATFTFQLPLIVDEA